MTSAKIIISEQDRSSIVPAMEGISAGIVITSNKGPVNVPTLITTVNQLIDVFGIPNPKLGVSMYSALNYLKQGNQLWVVRASHEDSKFAAVLVRSKVASLPESRTDGITPDHLIVNPVAGGLTQAQFDQYSFPVYRTNREYGETNATVFEASGASRTVRVSALDNIAVGDDLAFTDLALSALNAVGDDVGENQPTYTVAEIITANLTYENLILETPVTAAAGVEVLKKVGAGTESYPNAPKVVRATTASTNVLIDDTDYIGIGDTVVIGGVELVVENKQNYVEAAKYVELNGEVTVSAGLKIRKVVQSEFEERDALLVVAANQGAWGNKLSIAVSPSRDYDDAFNLIVYYDGVQVESWEVTRFNQIDGFSRQMEIEAKINGKSSYIRVINNTANVDEDGNFPVPLNTDYSLWRKDSLDVFVDSTNILVEPLLKGHVEVKLGSTANLALGTRIKFKLSETKVSAEYKVAALNSTDGIVTLDRGVEETEIPQSWLSLTNQQVNTAVLYFDATNMDSSNGIVNGIQYFKVSKIDKVYYNYALNSSFIISGESGTLLSAGANMTVGGSLGSTVTVGDLIIALNKLSNRERTPVNLVMDGGFTHVAYAQAISSLVDEHGLSHGYLSASFDSESMADYINGILDYKNSLNLNTHRCSLFTGWVKIYDEYNQLEVWASPDGFAAASQSYTTREFQTWYPAAGWTRGKVVGLDVKVKFTEGERDTLVDNRINPIRHKEGSGLVIWGNETLLVKPSPMQLRSVSMLLIVIRNGLENMLEFKTFDLNEESAWNQVEGSINAFMRDEIQAKKGVYAYECSVKGIITDTDIDNRRMPVFLGIQPTMDIKTIPVTLAIFNSSVDIEVSV